MKRFHWRIFAIAVVLALALAFVFGPYNDASYEDPLTGRHKSEVVWMGLRMHHRIEENEVSKWADQCSVPEIKPLQFGWSDRFSSERGWFTGTTVYCDGGYGIPERIFRGYIVVDGQSKRETLQSYQNDLAEEYYLRGSTELVQRRWAWRDQPLADSQRLIEPNEMEQSN